MSWRSSSSGSPVGFSLASSVMRQGDPSQVASITGIDDLDISALADQSGYFLEIDIAAVGDVIQPAIAVFFDDHARGLHYSRPSLLHCTQEK